MQSNRRPPADRRSPTHLIRLIAACLALLLSPVAALHAADHDASSEVDHDALPTAIKHAEQAGGAEVVRQFETDKPGLTGYIIKQQGRYQVVFGEDGYVLIGALVGPDGKNLSAEYADRYEPKPDVGAVVEKLENSDHLIQQGPDDAPLFYVFADPNCTYCHRFYQRAQPLVEAGRLQLQSAMVAFVKPSSIGRAAAILGADDPTAALAENEAGFDEQHENGGIEPADSPSAELKQAIQNYSEQMAAAGGTGTPAILYRNGKGKWATKVGVPSKAWLNAHAAQPKAQQ